VSHRAGGYVAEIAVNAVARVPGLLTKQLLATRRMTSLKIKTPEEFVFTLKICYRRFRFVSPRRAVSQTRSYPRVLHTGPTL
jgi:hypothetical protein